MRARHRLTAGTLTLGRGYDNDIVLDDPYVDAHHARLEASEDGSVLLTDLGSLNGLRDAGGARLSGLAVGPDTEVRVGRTRLRFRDSDAPPPPALPDTEAPREAAAPPVWARTPLVQLAITAAALGGAAWITWGETFTASPASDVVSLVLGIAVVGAVWAGVWAVAGRVVVHRFRFLGHLALITSLMFGAFLFVALAEWAEFLWPAQNWPDVAAALLWLFLSAALVSGHLSLASALSRRRRWAAGLAAGAVLFGIVGVMVLAEDDSFTDVPSFSGTLKPYAGRFLPTMTVGGFDAVAEDLIGEVDEEAAQD